jgi:hypothetical protein
MNHTNLLKIAAAVSSAILMLTPKGALADVSASVISYAASQVALSGAVRIGTVVTAFTFLPGLWASASYRLECSEANIRPALYGEQSGTNNGIVGPRLLVVTSPYVYPTEMALPGWGAVKQGTSFECVHYYSGAARTNLLPIGSGGASFPLGGDSWSQSDSLIFDVVKPGGINGGGCIP